MGAVGHIIGTLFKAIFRIIFTGLICGVIGAGATLFLVYSNSGGVWPPSLLGEIAAIAVGVLALYAGGITVLMVEAVKALQEAAKGMENEAGAALKGAGALVQEIEKHI
ncbi:MAG TPA: hypothetical protein VFQ25_09085 [Ktedonobacterales bacterium]|nr:hypothetical protein [Ktedonobacterales bacterium]